MGDAIVGTAFAILGLTRFCRVIGRKVDIAEGIPRGVSGLLFARSALGLGWMT